MRPALCRVAVIAPMEARSVAELPKGEGWQYEPKWDGFRCLAVRDGDDLRLWSKAGQPLERYFPEVVQHLLALKARRFGLDGELVIQQGRSLSFDALLQRIHPAASRVARLAQETPATYIVFDLLADDKGRPLVAKPLAARRASLEAFSARHFSKGGALRLSPATTELRDVKAWARDVGGALDGIIAKRREAPYDSGGRDAMVKVKTMRTADCVIGGFRYGEGTREVGSLLLGLYDDAGLLHHVGFCSGLKASEKPALTKRLEALVGPPGFTGRAPGGPSRWSTARSSQWQPLKPRLVVAVQYDHVSAGRFRHGTRLGRWRPDKAPEQCTMDQLRQVRGRLPALLR